MRDLKNYERDLLLCLLRDVQGQTFNLNDIKVEEINDGKMGSLYFIHDQKSVSQRKMGKCIAERKFNDSDNLPILVSLNVDEDGNLFELDIWKVDFSHIKLFPRCG